MKKALSILLSVLLLFGTFAFGLSAAAATVVDEGYCGANNIEAVSFPANTYDTNARWVLDNTGTLTISGEGEVYGRVSAMGETPWHLYNYPSLQDEGEYIKYLKIESGITNVPGACCLCNSGLLSVELADTVTHIDEWAFYLCSKLPYINIPDSVTEIRAHAFQHCDSLVYVKLPAHLTKISAYTFLDCENLQSVSIPRGVTLIEEQAFDDAEKFTDVYFAGSEEEWNQITVRSGNEKLLAATVHFNSEGPQIEPPAQPTDDKDDKNFFEKIIDWLRDLLDRFLALFK